MGLNDIYSVVRGQIMLMHPLPTVKKAYSLFCEEEKQKGLVEHKITKQFYAMNVKRLDFAFTTTEFLVDLEA